MALQSVLWHLVDEYNKPHIELCATSQCRRRCAGQFWSAAAPHRSKRNLRRRRYVVGAVLYLMSQMCFKRFQQRTYILKIYVPHVIFRGFLASYSRENNYNDNRVKLPN